MTPYDHIPPSDRFEFEDGSLAWLENCEAHWCEFDAADQVSRHVCFIGFPDQDAARWFIYGGDPTERGIKEFLTNWQADYAIEMREVN